MYFDVSEHIAANTMFPRAEVEKIDNFLAGRYVYYFRLRQVRELTRLNVNVSEILDEYVNRGVLRKGIIRICSVHGTILEEINRNEGFCVECDEPCAFKDCKTITMYKRLEKPERQKDNNT